MNGQDALDASISFNPNTTRRVGIDYATGNFVIFDETLGGVFHGHIRPWSELTQQMQAALRRSGLVNNRGVIQ